MHFPAALCCIVVTIVKVLANITSGLYTIHTEECTITGMSEFSESINKIVSEPPGIHNCTSAEPLVANNASHIWVKREAFDLYNIVSEDQFYCCYKFFSAPINLDNVVYSDCKEFLTVIKVENEFVYIDCYYSDEEIYRDFFLFNIHEDKTLNTFNMTFKDESYNILILGMESMSRLNFHRTMPLTSLFLKENGVVELLGYGKLGDNSYPNLFPLLTGQSFKDVKETCIRNHVFSFEKCPNAFIWDKFKKIGYHTALGSDSVAGLLGSYEYSMPRIPTDFYLQPFILETWKLFKNQYYHYHSCQGSKFYYKILLEYIYELTQHSKHNRLFGMFWEESISHENLNNPHIMDKSYYNFLTNLQQDNYLSKTIVIFVSDHGMRWGSIVSTEQGRLEALLPLLGILFPEKFRRRYKLAFENIQRNVGRLTTPYDVHETLLDLLNLDSLEDNMISKRVNSAAINKSSLFFRIPGIRNCKSVAIEEHWCPCHRQEKIKMSSKFKTIIANKLVEKINKLLNDFPQCSKLMLAHIYDVYLVERNKQWRIYSVRVKTIPGSGIFDGTLINSKSHWGVSGTVSRLNLYRNQSHCVDNYDSVKMYCYCG